MFQWMRLHGTARLYGPSTCSATRLGSMLNAMPEPDSFAPQAVDVNVNVTSPLAAVKPVSVHV